MPPQKLQEEVPAAAAQKPTVPVAQLAQRAQALHKAGHLQEAVRVYEELLSLKPDIAEAHNNLGIALKALGQVEAAIEHYRQALQIRPEYADAYNNMGNALQDLHQYEEAIVHYEQALALKPGDINARNNWENANAALVRQDSVFASQPDHVRGYHNLGLSLHALGKLAEAIAHYEQALLIDAQNPWTHIYLGNACQALGKSQEAADHYERAVLLQADNIVALNNSGIALQLLGNSELAVEYHERALAANPDHAFSHTCLGNTLLAMGRTEEAIEHYEQGLSLQAGDAGTHNNLGNALQAQGRTVEAIAHYQQVLAAKPERPAVQNNDPQEVLARRQRLSSGALSIQPDYAYVHYHLGLALQDQDEWLEAVNQYRQALTLRPDISGAVEKWEAIVKQVEKMQPCPLTQAEHADILTRLGLALDQQGNREAAIQYHQQALVIEPDNALIHNFLGNALLNKGSVAEAIASYRQAVALQQDSAGAHNNLAMALLSTGRDEEAFSHLEQAIMLKPDFAEAHNNLGNLLTKQGRLDAAISNIETALKTNPDFASAHYNLGIATALMGKLQEALIHYQRALAIQPDYSNAHVQLGATLHKLGRISESMVHFEKALSLQPDAVEVLVNTATSLYAMGKIEEGIALDEKAIKIAPDFAAAYRHLAMVSPEKVDKASAHQLLDKPDTSDDFATNLCFALGDVYKAEQSFDRSFEFFRRGNQLKRKSLNFDAAEHKAEIDQLIETYSRDFVQEKSALGVEDDFPVFILGMPRSGTTLVEQILSSHADVHGAGEMLYLHLLQKGAPGWLQSDAEYPACMVELDASTAREMATDYLWRLRDHAATARHITDKLPGNYLRVGLIKILFPRARIIHCRRHPVDTCLSIYTHWFAGDHPYAYDLPELGNYYLEYERLMSHWHDLFADEIMEIQHEELVNNVEGISRQMIDQLGLQWDENCLEFHRHQRPVMTASNLQVRKPIFTDSVNRWKKYEQHLGPLIEVLSASSYMDS